MVLVVLALLSSSFMPSDLGLPRDKSVPYSTATNYFVRNDVQEDDLKDPRIDTKERFERIFGMAATMGKKGHPTPIDLSRQYAIALVTPLTDREVSLSVKSLTRKAGQVTLTYQMTEGAVRTFTSRPFLLLVVDRKYDGPVTIRRAP